jgi:hypothetical protein
MNTLTYAIGIASFYLGTIYLILQNIILLILGYYKIRLCESRSNRQYNIIKDLSPYSTMIDIDGPTSWIIDKNWSFCAYVIHGDNKYYMLILSREAFLIKHNFINLEVKEIVEEKEDITLKIWEREGNYHWLSYSRRCIKFTMVAQPHQQLIIDRIHEHSKDSINSVILLYGEPGTGKSVIPMLLAKNINGSYVTSFNPTNPGDTLLQLIISIKPTIDKKLVIVFEEVDGMIDDICNDKIAGHKNLPTLIKNKQNWNTFFDNIGTGFYEHIILIMTTNIDPQSIGNGDTSYLRKGRVDMKINVINSKDDDLKND